MTVKYFEHHLKRLFYMGQSFNYLPDIPFCLDFNIAQISKSNLKYLLNQTQNSYTKLAIKTKI